jgi:thioredoxin/glutathione reductase (selenoprotein)
VKVTATNIVIAVGGRPHYEAIPGAKEYAITSDDLFWLPKAPGKTLVVGASYVALECAGFLTHLGFPTTLMVRSIFLRGYDQDMASRVGSYMEKHGVRVLKETVPILLSKAASGKTLVRFKIAKDGQENEEEFDTVLLAIGRYAVTEDLKLANVGIKPEANGKIRVNELEQTVVPNIYAIGDVIFGRPELTPVAIKAGRLLAQRILGKSQEVMDYVNVPSTVYTPLEYGFCGLSEDEAITKFGKDAISVYHSSFKPLEWNFLASREDDVCYTKVVVEKATRKVLGFHYLGPNAGEVSQGYAVAIKCGVTKEQWDKTVGIHPTCAEELLSLQQTKEANPNAKKTGC